MKSRHAKIAPLFCTLLLAACQGDGVSIKAEKQTASAAVIDRPRSEPIFYNGKTYQLDFAPAGKGTFNMAVAGMGPKQEKDAVQLATSSLRYYACPDGKTGKLLNQPSYAGGTWRMAAHCA